MPTARAQPSWPKLRCHPPAYSSSAARLAEAPVPPACLLLGRHHALQHQPAHLHHQVGDAQPAAAAATAAGAGKEDVRRCDHAGRDRRRAWRRCRQCGQQRRVTADIEVHQVWQQRRRAAAASIDAAITAASNASNLQHVRERRARPARRRDSAEEPAERDHAAAAALRRRLHTAAAATCGHHRLERHARHTQPTAELDARGHFASRRRDAAGRRRQRR
mmetsp:Transcript_27947/g.82877  ORF Transcript_27947/g.82877 Transcript_27947/m.82877 type:complete len:219 (+) Transcript_27947:1002-1658(+)